MEERHSDICHQYIFSAIYVFKVEDLCVLEYLCDVRMMVRPLSLTLVRVFHSVRLATGSIPVVGSSRNTMGGSPIRAMAALNLRLLPPL